MIGEDLKEKKFNTEYHVGKTLKDLEEGKYNVGDWNLQGEHTLIAGQKSVDKNPIEKEIVSKKMSEDTVQPPVLGDMIDTKLVTMPVPKTTQPVVEDCKNMKCVSTELCDNPGGSKKKRRRKNNMFDTI